MNAFHISLLTMKLTLAFGIVNFAVRQFVHYSTCAFDTKRRDQPVIFTVYMVSYTGPSIF
jgi:hypothetical protein